MPPPTIAIISVADKASEMNLCRQAGKTLRARSRASRQQRRVVERLRTHDLKADPGGESRKPMSMS